jgi:hypothetical protein
MKINVLFVRHCESCSNLIVHSKSRTKKIRNIKQAGIVSPNCTMLGLMQAFMFGNIVIPLIFKNFPKFQKIDFYCSILKRAMITTKIVTHGLQRSSCKVRTSPTIHRLCHISEKVKKIEKSALIPRVNNVSIKKSTSQLRDINKIYKKTGKTLNKKIKKETKKCNKTDFNLFMKYVLPTLNLNALNVVVTHSKFMKHNLGLKLVNNLDACLVEFDTTKNNFKIILEIKNKSKSSNDQLSEKTIKKDPIEFHYKSQKFNHKTEMKYSDYKKHMEPLSDFLQFEKKQNDITCNK